MTHAAILLAVLLSIAAPDPAATDARPVPGTHQCHRYPDASRRTNESGTTIVRYDVDPAGRIVNIVVWKSSGHPILDQTAVICVGVDWREYPAMRKGVPVASPNHLAAVEFHLLDGPATAPARRAVIKPLDTRDLWLPASILGASVLILALVIAITILLDNAKRARRDGGN
ncbi:MAG TPA: energy transducer TonB [Rhizomicrobium sp.]|jgi:TonB family protein|nr:energy transducer TonB [Rhizomicrobium sp.]